jgi:integral membrane protein 2B
MWEGYYSVNTGRVRETMRVVLPPLDDLSDLGNYIQQECQDKTTYSLEKSTSRIIKRSVLGSAALPFVEFAGKNTLEYEIVNLDQLDVVGEKQ